MKRTDHCNALDLEPCTAVVYPGLPGASVSRIAVSNCNLCAYVCMCTYGQKEIYVYIYICVYVCVRMCVYMYRERRAPTLARPTLRYTTYKYEHINFVEQLMREPHTPSFIRIAKVVPRGLEPRTLRLLAVRSNQLSYETFC